MRKIISRVYYTNSSMTPGIHRIRIIRICKLREETFRFMNCDNLADGSERDSPGSCGGGISTSGRRPLTSIIEHLRVSKSKLLNVTDSGPAGGDHRDSHVASSHRDTHVDLGTWESTLESNPKTPMTFTDSGEIPSAHTKRGIYSAENNATLDEHSGGYPFGEVAGETVSSGGGTRVGDRGESADLATHTETSDGDTLAANAAVDGRDARGGGSPQGAHLSGAATPRPARGRRRQNQNGLDTAQVKTERLTPDNNSTSSRSVTPLSLSHPGTPPNATSLGGPEGPQPPHHLKHMEQMMGRNYSDFMRSLAAKYNNAHPNDYFSTPRNGYTPGLDPRFPAFKTGTAPFVGLMTPLVAPQPPTVPTTSPLSNNDPKEQKNETIFNSPVFPPMLDMSSTQALLHMVRTANAAQNVAELETYLKGANKRDTAVTSPLDLSNPGGFAPRKRQRAEMRRPESVSPKPKPSQRPTTPPPVRCPSLCGHMPCGDGQSVNRWSVEDVVNYVSSIDICSEYAQNFREHRIDGAALPLLSEDHLTGPMGMKLGPALKLRALLARKLGACTVCLHCAHCHQTPLPALTAAASVAATQAPGRRPSSTGN